MSSSAEVTHALEVALKKVSDEFKDMPDGNEMTEKITAKFVQTCNSPPVKEFEFLLRKTFTDEEVCMVLFQPGEEQIEYFPIMLAVISSLPESHPIKKLSPLLVSLLFLVHRKNWEFMKIFISCNGMIVMADFLDSDNLYLRGQALEVILSATDCDVFDWFKSPSSYSEKVLHQNLLAFGRSPLTMTKLFANRIGSYPGGSFRALQILAFVLSWIRALYTADQKLQLSKVAIENLKEWAQYDGPLPILHTESSSDTQLEDPEIQLARTLLDDFTGEKNAPTGTTGTSTEALSVGEPSEKSASSGDFILSNLDTTSLAGTELPTISSISTPASSLAVVDTVSDTTSILSEMSVLEMKEKGNAEFKASHYTAAREWYHKGITTLKVASKTNEKTDSFSDTELAASLYTNAATAAWKIVQDALIQLPELELQAAAATTAAVAIETIVGVKEEKNKALEREFHTAVEQCRLDCLQALQLHPQHTKAAYRLASLYLLQQHPQKALEVVNACITANILRTERKDPMGVSTEGEDEEIGASGSADLDMLQQIKRRCIAAVLLSSYSTSQDRDLRNLGLDTKTSEVLSNLLVQYQIELDLPVVSSTTIPTSSTSTSTTDLTKNTTTVKQSQTVKKSTSSTEGSTTRETTEKAKSKKKKASTSTSSTGTASIAQRLQQMDDELLDSLMKKGSIKA